jgi:hypothetical protein
MSSNNHIPNSFAAVLRPAAPLPRPVSLIVPSKTIAEFIDACDSAVVCGLPVVGELLPGVDVEEPSCVLMAFLLFMATEGLFANCESITGELVTAWHTRVTPRVWRLLGYQSAPSLLSVELAFPLLVYFPRKYAPDGRA